MPYIGGESLRERLDRETRLPLEDTLRCQSCKDQFTVRIGTVFEDSKIPHTARSRSFPQGRGTGRGTDSKTPVVAMLERGGRVRARVVTEVTARTLRNVIRGGVKPSAARLHTDELSSYIGIGREFAGGHETVRHSNYEYARGDVHVNTAESFFALLKRGLIGTFHAVSKRHLHRYVLDSPSDGIIAARMMVHGR